MGSGFRRERLSTRNADAADLQARVTRRGRQISTKSPHRPRIDPGRKGRRCIWAKDRNGGQTISVRKQTAAGRHRRACDRRHHDFAVWIDQAQVIDPRVEMITQSSLEPSLTPKSPQSDGRACNETQRVEGCFMIDLRG